MKNQKNKKFAHRSLLLEKSPVECAVCKAGKKAYGYLEYSYPLEQGNA